MLLDELVRLSNKFGRDVRFVLAGGGNTSVKTEEHLYIKGSGTALATITRDGFVKMNRKKLANIWENTYPEQPAERESAVLADLMDAREASELAKRPSVETFLHDLLPGRFVVHLHPALVNGLTCSKGGKELAEALFGKDIIWIENSEPGYVLARLVREKLIAFKEKTGRDGDVLFLENHGIFVSAESPEEAENRYTLIMKTLEAELKEVPDLKPVTPSCDEVAAFRGEIEKLGYASVVFETNKTMAELLESKETFAPLANPFTPDHIVYCKAEPLFAETAEEIKEKAADYERRNGFKPVIIACKGLGFFACCETEKKAEFARQLFCDAEKIAVYTRSFGGYSHMPERLVDFIVHWEAESYRSKVN